MSILLPELSADPSLARFLLNPPPQTLAVGCLEDSLSYGYWRVSDFAYRRSGGISGEPLIESIYFQVIDGIIGESAIECEASKDWTATDPESSAFCESSNPATTFKFYLGDEGYGTLNINQIWSCPSDEEGTQIIFKAYANLNVTNDPSPTSPQDPLVIEEAGPITIPFTLIAPVEITPSEEVPPPPPGSQAPSCKTASQAPKFTVTDLTWLWFNESRESPPIPIGAVLANITNELTGETSSCMHTGGLDLFPSEEGGDCETSEASGFTLCSGTVAADEYGPSYLNQVAIRFDPCSKTIQIVESWYCDADDGDDSGAKYAAFGDLAPVSWDCQLLGEVESLPDASPGLPAIGTVIRNATVCNAVLGLDNNVAEGAVIVEHSLFADAFLYQAPRARGCLVDSMKPETWYWNLFPNSFLADVEPDGTVTSMRSRLELGIAAPYGSPAFYCFTPAHSLFGDCSFPHLPGGRFLTSKGVFDPDTNVFSLEQSWECYDRSPNHPVIFTAKGAIAVPEPSQDPVRIMMDITWQTSRGPDNTR